MKQPRTLKSRALQLLAQREQSRFELRRKLLAHALPRRVGAPAGFDGTGSGGSGADDPDADVEGARIAAAVEVDEVLAWLETQGFLSAERFAESRVNARVGRYGNLRIRHELSQHRIALAPEAERTLADTELDRARAVRARKFPQPPASAGERARQARFLGARGFSADTVRQVLREASRPPRSDPA